MRPHINTTNTINTNNNIKPIYNTNKTNNDIPDSTKKKHTNMTNKNTTTINNTQ